MTQGLSENVTKNIVLTIAYDGTNYFGWQKTNRGPSVEEALQKVLEKILQHKIHLQAASRTDRGVHADAQIVNFFTTKKHLDLGRLQLSLNKLLSPDIRIMEIHEASDTNFHPTLKAIAKEYHYKIATGDVLSPSLRFTHWHVPYAQELQKMEEACPILEGTHDFAAFQNFRKDNHKDTIRTLFDVRLHKKEAHTFIISLKGTSFLYKMARNLVGTIIYVGMNKMALKELKDLLKKGKRDEAGITAPALGLTLHKVYYGKDVV